MKRVCNNNVIYVTGSTIHYFIIFRLALASVGKGFSVMPIQNLIIEHSWIMYFLSMIFLGSSSSNIIFSCVLCSSLSFQSNDVIDAPVLFYVQLWDWTWKILVKTLGCLPLSEMINDRSYSTDLFVLCTHVLGLGT